MDYCEFADDDELIISLFVCLLKRLSSCTLISTAEELKSDFLTDVRQFEIALKFIITQSQKLPFKYASHLKLSQSDTN